MRRHGGAILGMLFLAHAASGQFAQQGGKLVGTGAIGDANQGASVAISADGTTAIVGGPADNAGVGAAWVYTRSGGVWSQQGVKLVCSDAVGAAALGTSVAISPDGNTAVIGGPGDNNSAGAVWVLTRSGGVWSQQGYKLVGTGADGNACQGRAVAISADGHTVAVGGSCDSGGMGAVWVYTRGGDGWSQQGGKLVGTPVHATSAQGTSVAISADGSTTIVGAPGDGSGNCLAWAGNPCYPGAAWVFARNAGVWSQQGSKLVPDADGPGQQGTSVGISADGNTAILGAPYDEVVFGGHYPFSGAAWVCTRTGGVWTQQGDQLVLANGEAAYNQGNSVALSGGGNTAVVGIGGAVGAALVYKRCSGVWFPVGGPIVGTDGAQQLLGSSSVALSANASTLIVGGAGAAWVFGVPCSSDGVPIASFSWSPSGPLAGFPEQQQPYVGQAVTLADTSTDYPAFWEWCDFEELGPSCGSTPLTSSSVTVTWSTAGPKSVRMRANNCSGWSDRVQETVTVYPDVRHVTAEFSWDPGSPSAGAPVTFTAADDFAHGSPTDFTWDFGDTSPEQTGRSTAHTYSCGGAYTVTMTASGHGKTSLPLAKVLTVGGPPCPPESFVLVDAADVAGLNGTFWSTDLRVFNPDTAPTGITICALPAGQNNANPWCGGPVVVNPEATLYIHDVLAAIRAAGSPTYTKAALKITYDNPNSVAPMIVSRTSTKAPGGGTYGQYTPSIGVLPHGIAPSTVWVTGLENDGTGAGFRTNYSLVNLRGDAGGVGNIKATLIDPTGAELAQKTIGLAPYGYVQDSIAKLFGAQFATVGTLAVRVDVPDGADIQFFASVVDNLTGAPVLIPAVAQATSPIYIAAAAHNPGENGTVWRSDMQITNPDTAPHTWQLTFVPKGAGNPLTQTIALGPHNTIRTDDVVGFIYGLNGLPVPEASGAIRIAAAPGDASGVYPIIASRSYNLTPAGTFGQNNVPLTAAMGISTSSKMQRLLITGMSSQDVQRTNFGFVNLSENNGVDFSVIFYDQSGNVLNPIDTGTGRPKPYTFALNVWGWDQDRLENRLRHLGVALPAGMQGISAEITVTSGGPGFVYATVIDNLTGDPMFIPGQLAP